MIPGTPIIRREQLVGVYKYTHIYSAKRQLGQTLTINNNQFHHHVKPDLHFLREHMNEIHWEDRLSKWNHAHHFSLFFTGMVDTFPVCVSQPEDSLLLRTLFNPKYNTHVYKFQCAVDFLGRILLLTTSLGSYV